MYQLLAVYEPNISETISEIGFLFEIRRGRVFPQGGTSHLIDSSAVGATRRRPEGSALGVHTQICRGF